MATLARRGLMLVLSSPSGAGKSTLARLLLEAEEDVELSLSVPTRAPRPSENDGVHYNFLSRERFEAVAGSDGLLEWAEVHGNFYGSPRAPIEAALKAGRDVLFDIDWQGARQLAARMPEDTVRVFVLPPSMAELRARLERRAEDAPAVIERRMRNARAEIAQWRDYDYLLVNDDVGNALGTVRAILRAERARRQRLVGLPAFIEGLIGGEAEAKAAQG